MKLGRVIGNIVATIKTPSHDTRKIMVVQGVTHTGEPVGTPFIALDAAQAGIGDAVIVLEEGRGIRSVMDRNDAAVDALIVGVVDHVDANGERSTLLEPSEGDTATVSAAAQRRR